jgi:hypothetical protein
VLESLAMQAGLAPVSITEITCMWDYANEQTAVRGILAAGVSASVIQYAGEEHAPNAVTQALAPFKKPSGHYQLRNTFLYLITKA